MSRVILWLLLVVIGIGIAFSAWIIVLSLGPHPGDRMVLMGLPCVAGPVAVAALATLLVTATDRRGLSRWERRVAWVAGGLALAVYGALVVLG